MNENEREVYLDMDDSPIARILHYLAITATSDELLEALFLDMQTLGMAIHPQLLSDARNTFNTLSQQRTNNNANTSANNNANSLPPAAVATTATRRLVANPYKLFDNLRRKPRTMYSIITAKRKKKVNSNSNTIKSTGPGRPKGKKNKPGHSAGGNRKSAQYVKQTGDQSSLHGKKNGSEILLFHLPRNKSLE